MRAGSRSYQGVAMAPIWVLIGVNFLVFVATLVDRNLVISLLGLKPASFTSEPWTIITSMFVHASFWHIFANMFTLFFFGSYLLRLVGESKFLIIYFVGGILGNILLLALAPIFPFRVAIGASGAVFAIGGALAVMRPRLKVFIFPIPLPIDLWIAVIGGFLVMSFAPGIAWQAHLGGLIVGLIAGYIFKKRERGILW